MSYVNIISKLNESDKERYNTLIQKFTKYMSMFKDMCVKGVDANEAPLNDMLAEIKEYIAIKQKVDPAFKPEIPTTLDEVRLFIVGGVSDVFANR